MNNRPRFSPTEVESLIAGRCITDQYPWSTEDSTLVEGHLKRVCASVLRDTGAKSRIDWDHYGSGYASFVDAWFYRDSPDFGVKVPLRYGEEHTGLVVLFSRLSPYFSFMEGEKRWHSHGGSSYMPEADLMDKLESKGVASLALQVQPILESHGLVRVFREELSEPLVTRSRVPTVLADRGFTQFDALFYWED